MTPEFYQKDCQRRNANHTAHILSNSHSYVGEMQLLGYNQVIISLHFYRGRMFYHEKDAQNVVTPVKLFIVV